jgi:RNA ligase (TIGR02306 family)
MERKLVTIRTVSELKPIPGADKIETAVVDGWDCVVNTGKFLPGDRCVYFEIDSFLPIEERYEFLRKYSYRKLPDGREGFRLKTIKLRGHISQGLLMPLSDFPELDENVLKENDCDLSKILSVTKYEPPIPAVLSGVVKGSFPWFVQKTDEERIQNLPDYFGKYKNVFFEETEKLDGASCTYYRNDGAFGVCSRNLELLETNDNTFWQLAKDINVKESLERLNKNIALQGEVLGAGINKNTLQLSGRHFYVFNVYDIDNRHLMTPDERRETIKTLNNEKIEHAPVINERIDIFNKKTDIKELLEHAKGKSKLNLKRDREGVVFKSHCLLDGNARIVSFKVVSNDYLLEEE